MLFKRELDFEGENGENGKINGSIDKDAISQRLEEVYKRLELIDADSAEARAASILAVSDSILLIIAVSMICTQCELEIVYLIV